MYYFIDLVRGSATVPGWFSLFMVASQFLALVTVPSVLLQRQGRPRAALSWLVTLFALPSAGVVAWWAFGRTSIERKRRKRAAIAKRFVERRGTPHSEKGTPFDDLVPALALGDSIFTTNGNAVELLVDGRVAFPIMEEAIAGARRSIHVMFYIFRNDSTGRRFRDLLAKKAREGVSVRVLVDAWGSPRFTGRFADPLRQAGAKVAAFLPSHLMPLQAPRLNFANHRKIIVVDEHVAFIGGMNVGAEYESGWHDLMARIEGPAVPALDHVFLDDWYFASDEDLQHAEHEQGVQRGDVACAVVVSGPDRESFIHDAYFMLFTRARTRIWIVTPYFIPTDALATALRTAAGRGVDVRVILPLRSDMHVVKHAARSFYLELVTAGVKIYEYQGAMLHAKAIMVDDDLAVLGSANVDTRSFRLSFEIGCLFKDPALCGRLVTWCGEIIRDSDHVTKEECEGRSTAHKLLQSAAHLFSPLL